MKSLTPIKLIFAASGLVVWGIGIRANDAVLQYVGIGLLLMAVLIRFVLRSDVEN